MLMEQNKHLIVKPTAMKGGKTTLKKNFIESMLLETFLQQEGIPRDVESDGGK